MENQKKETKRFRNFATVVYPESAPENWQSILADECVPGFISPLHDQDFNPTGEEKKEHYHVLLLFEGVKTTEQVKEIFDRIGGVGCETVKSIRAYARYLCHLDNPDKHQYSQEYVINLGGADYHDVCGTPSDRYHALDEMVDWVVDHDARSFAELVLYAKQHRHDWNRVLMSTGAVYMREFIKSYHWAQTKGFDPYDGES